MKINMIDCKEWGQAMSSVYGRFAEADCIDRNGVVSVSLVNKEFIHNDEKVSASVPQERILECLNSHISLYGEELKIEHLNMDGVCSFGPDLYSRLASTYISDGYRTVVCQSDYYLPDQIRSKYPFKESTNVYPKIAEAAVRVCRVWEDVYIKTFSVDESPMRKYAYCIHPNGLLNIMDGVVVSRTDMTTNEFLWLVGKDNREFEDAISYLMYVAGSMDGDVIQNIVIIPSGGVHTMQLSYDESDTAQSLLLY